MARPPPLLKPLLQSAQGLTDKPFIVYPNSGEDWSNRDGLVLEMLFLFVVDVWFRCDGTGGQVMRKNSLILCRSGLGLEQES